MKVYSFMSLIAAVSALSTVAVASDLPSKKQAPKTPVSENDDWSGLYSGFSLGGSLSTSFVENRFQPDIYRYDIVEPANSGKMTQSTFVPSFGFGYNWQKQNIVYGFEADISYLNFNKSRSIATAYEPPNTSYGLRVNDSVSASFQATLRSRIGIAQGNGLYYLTAGLGIANLSHAHAFSEYGSNIPEIGTGWCYRYNLCDNGGSTENKLAVGWVIGAGAAWQIDRKWSFLLEYLHSQYPSLNAQTQWYNPDHQEWINNSYVQHSADLKIDMIRFGLNYKY